MPVKKRFESVPLDYAVSIFEDSPFEEEEDLTTAEEYLYIYLHESPTELLFPKKVPHFSNLVVRAHDGVASRFLCGWGHA